MAKKRARADGNPWPELLKQMREDLDLLQEQAAERLGVSLSAWRSWEQGQRRPSKTAQRLLRITFPDAF